METLVSVTHTSTTDRKVVTCSSDLRNQGVPKYQNEPHTKSQLTTREQYSGNDHVAHNFTCASLHFAHPFTTPTAFSSPLSWVSFLATAFISNLYSGPYRRGNARFPAFSPSLLLFDFGHLLLPSFLHTTLFHFHIIKFPILHTSP